MKQYASTRVTVHAHRYKRTKPIIAAVDGAALAGGCEIVLACDLVVASKSSRFGVPEVKRSLAAAAGGLFRLPRKLPKHIAMEMCKDPCTDGTHGA